LDCVCQVDFDVHWLAHLSTKSRASVHHGQIGVCVQSCYRELLGKIEETIGLDNIQYDINYRRSTREDASPDDILYQREEHAIRSFHPGLAAV